MTDIDRALTLLANAKSERHWLRAAAELRGICHTQAGVACERCHGKGTRPYGNSSGWRGGAGVSPCEDDVCDLCWGTGRSDLMGVDLRELEGRAQRLEDEHGRAASAEWMAARLGVELDVVRRLLPPLAARLRNLRGVEFWTARLCERMADALEEMAVVSRAETSATPTIKES